MHFKGESQQHFSLRKLTIGVASVIIGTTFMFFGGHAVHADDLSRDAEQTSSVVQKQSSEKIDVDAVKEADNVSNQRQDLPSSGQVERANNDVKSNQDSEASKQKAQAIKRVETVNAKDLAKSENTDNSVENKSVVKTAASDQAKATKVVPTVKPNIPGTFKNPIQVSNWDQFDAAFRDKNVDQIVLNNDIDVTGGRNKVFDNRGISRTVEITSTENNRYTMNFGNHFMSLWDNAQNGSDQGWNIIIKNVDIKSTDDTYSPIFTRDVSVKNSKKDTIIYDNVNFDGHQFSRTDAANIVLAGTVNINSVLESGDYAAIDAYSFKVADGANVTLNVREDSKFNHNTTEYRWGNTGVRTWYNDGNDAVVIGSGATFRFNSN